MSSSPSNNSVGTTYSKVRSHLTVAFGELNESIVASLMVVSNKLRDEILNGRMGFHKIYTYYGEANCQEFLERQVLTSNFLAQKLNEDLTTPTPELGSLFERCVQYGAWYVVDGKSAGA